PPAQVTMGGETSRLVVADFNRDRKADIATTLWVGGGQVAVTLGNGDGTFKPPSTYPAGVSPGEKAAGDLNHDRYPDLVVVNFDAQTIQVLLNDGSWTAPVPRIGLTGDSGAARPETSSISRPNETPRTNTIFDEGIAQSNAAGTPFLPAHRAPTPDTWINAALTVIFVEDSMP